MSAFYIEHKNSDLILHNKYGQYSMSELESQLKEGHLTVKELGEIYQLKEYQVVHVFNALGIIDRNTVNDSRIIDCTITPEMHQVLLGTLMGDAYMKEPKSYMLSHGLGQTEYLYYVANCLSPFVASVGYRKVKTGEFLVFWTHRHNVFIPYFNRFYSHGKTKKYLTLDVVYDLDSRGLAFWYMDDGKFNEYGSNLCVGNISIEEGMMLVKFLKDKFNIESTFQSQNDVKGYYNIYIKAESRDHFCSLIEPFIISSMRYKLIGETPKKGIYNRALIKRGHRKLCEEAQKFINFLGDEEIIKFTNLKFYYKDRFIESIKQAIIDKSQISYTKFREEPSGEILKEMFSEGKTDQQIANIFGFGRNRIAKLRRYIGIPDKRTR
jgi:hypothetical protein